MGTRRVAVSNLWFFDGLQIHHLKPRSKLDLGGHKLTNLMRYVLVATISRIEKHVR
jgi:hypothetical protein